MIEKVLLDKLACPGCQGILSFYQEKLSCQKCHHDFEIRNNLIDFSPEKFLNFNEPKTASWKRTEIERFEDLESYQELMSRPYFLYLKSQIKKRLFKFGLKGKSILEVGAGQSIFSLVFDNSNLVVLTDINKRLLGQNEGSRFLVVADAEHLPFKDNSFDFVYTVGLIHHLPNQAMGLKELKRVVSSSGQIFISEPTKWSLNLFYYLGRQLLIKIFGSRFLKKLIGCGTPYESFIDLAKVNYVFKDWELKKKCFLPFRLPPFKALDRMSWPVSFSRFLEKIPLLKRLGTIVFLDLRPVDQDRGYGTEYEKFVLKKLFHDLIEKYHFKSVSEWPANNLMGNHQEIFENLDVELRRENSDLVWNFCEFDYAEPKEFFKELKKIKAKYFVVITQNNKNPGVWLHRLYHWFLGKDWNHGKIRNMSYRKVINLVQNDPVLKVREVIAFDLPWFILDVYETSRIIKKFLPTSLLKEKLKLSCFESWPFSLKKFLAHHFLILIERS